MVAVGGAGGAGAFQVEGGFGAQVIGDLAPAGSGRLAISFRVG